MEARSDRTGLFRSWFEGASGRYPDRQWSSDSANSQTRAASQLWTQLIFSSFLPVSFCSQMSDTTPRRLSVEHPTNVTLEDVITTASPKCRLCPEAHPLRKYPKLSRINIASNAGHILILWRNAGAKTAVWSACRNITPRCIFIAELAAVKTLQGQVNSKAVPVERAILKEEALLPTTQPIREIRRRAQPTTRLWKKMFVCLSDSQEQELP